MIFNTVRRLRILKHGISGYESVRVIDDGNAVFEKTWCDGKCPNR